MLLEQSEMPKPGAESMHPKYQAAALDVRGEELARMEAWERARAEQIMESKSVGKPLKVREPRMPQAGPLEPAKRGTDSIQAVSAAKLPTSVLKQGDSSIPSYQTRFQHVMKNKYMNHQKPPVDPNYKAHAKLLGLTTLDDLAPPQKEDENIHYS